MGYDQQQITVHVRLERHNSEGDIRDNEAFARLRQEIDMMIAADPDYARIASVSWVA